jgi:hypothetical protein
MDTAAREVPSGIMRMTFFTGFTSFFSILFAGWRRRIGRRDRINARFITVLLYYRLLFIVCIYLG